MNYQRLKMGLIAAAVVGVAACADSPLSPSAAPSGGISASLIGVSTKHRSDTTVTTFTINPKSSTRFNVGSKHALYIPAKSVCDPETSSYGIGTWDDDCAPLKRELKITAKTWIGDDGLPKVEFEPALRFTTNNKGNDVTLYMFVDSKGEADRGLTIYYCPGSATVGCMDEAQSDSSLATHYDSKKGVVYRRIKHFSVYNVSSGRTADDGSAMQY